uniref:WD40 repeat domain-containing protein n=1 Tax=candidate division WOR-3 bacterium TaxID=2052148 RepID=A0A7C4X825_UNCW3
MFPLIINLFLLNIFIKSNNGEFRGEVIYTCGLELIASSFTLYNNRGEKIYSLSEPKGNTFFISDFGVVFATDEQGIYFYDKGGKTKELKRLNYPNGFNFSPDNSLFFASDRDGIYVFSMSGDLIYRLNPGRLFLSTETGERIFVVSNDTLLFYKNGKLASVKVLPTPYIREINFTEDREGVIIRMREGVDTLFIQKELQR